MRRFQIGWLLLATGIFIPLVTVPFAEGYRHAAGLIENIQSMSLPLMPDKYEPVFEEISVGEYSDLFGPFVDVSSTGELSPTAAAVPKDVFDGAFGPHTGNIRLFTNGHPDDEIGRALKASRSQIEKSKTKYLAYHGWAVSRKAVRLPFSLIVAVSMLVAFAGVVLLIFSRKRTL
jgi:hypothetical protein